MSPSDLDDPPHIATTTTDRLVYMANQITRFFQSQDRSQAISGISKHIADFWDPRMRQSLRVYVEDGGQGLDPMAKEAILSLKR